jgi:hypothetical protein
MPCGGDHPPIPAARGRGAVLPAARRPGYPENLHDRALTHVTVIRHAIGVLLDDLEGSTTIDVQ